MLTYSRGEASLRNSVGGAGGGGGGGDWEGGGLGGGCTVQRYRSLQGCVGGKFIFFKCYLTL